MFSLNLNSKLFLAGRPLVMGILNATPDSFFDASRIRETESALIMASGMVAAGADMIDIGGQSTRPGSVRISAAEEMDRVLPLIHALRRELPDIPLSIDTYQSEVAVAAVEAGANIVNDISSGTMDPRMLEVVGTLGVPYVCMHMQGTPEHMQSSPVYTDVLADVMAFFRLTLTQCAAAGIRDVIIDPGFGFGKTLRHNYQLLEGLDILKSLGCPLLVGISRKSMIREVLDVPVSGALNGTTVLHTLALMKGADILRVHDVREALEAVLLVEQCHHSLIDMP